MENAFFIFQTITLGIVMIDRTNGDTFLRRG
jgi:hypothetical protein